MDLEIAGLAESRKDIRAAAALMGREEIRYFVSYYYQVQEYRKSAGNMDKDLQKREKPNRLVKYLHDSQRRIEEDIKISLYVAANNDKTGQWLMSVHGIGPVMACGLLAHIDAEKAVTVGHIWNFAGLNPGISWEKGEKRPWNAELKRLCWLIGDSFVKTSNNEGSVYGPIYRQRKAVEVRKNDAREFADQAAATLEKRNIRDKATRAVYEDGRLPAGRIDLRARRVAVKLFLSHFHDVMCWHEKGERAPAFYAKAILGHAHEVPCPNPPWPQARNRA